MQKHILTFQIALICLFSGCESNDDLDVARQYLLGQPSRYAVSLWGAPSVVIPHENGGKTMVWTRHTSVTLPGHANTTLYPSPLGPTQAHTTYTPPTEIPIEHSCMVYVDPNDIIRSWSPN